MSTLQHQRILIQLDSARLLHAGIVGNADIAARLAVFGVDAALLTEGAQLLAHANDTVTGQDRAIAEQKAATEAVLVALETAYTAYTLTSEVARAAVAGDKTRLALLGITGKAPRTVATLLPRGKTLLDGLSAHPELASLLAQYGQNAAALAALRAAFDALATADTRQQTAKGTAQRATTQQADALKALAAWVSKVKRLARIALKSDRQQLEKLGIVARSKTT